MKNLVLVFASLLTACAAEPEPVGTTSSSLGIPPEIPPEDEPAANSEFSDALITETTFPALDKGALDPGYIKIKVKPPPKDE